MKIRNIRFKKKTLPFFILFFVFADLLASVIGNFLLITICNALFGAENNRGIRVAMVLMLLLVPVISYTMIYFYKRKDRDACAAYRDEMIGKEYDAKADLHALWHDPFLWGEFLIVAVLTVIFWFFHIRSFWVLFNVPLFALFDLYSTRHIHRLWFKARGFTHMESDDRSDEGT